MTDAIGVAVGVVAVGAPFGELSASTSIASSMIVPSGTLLGVPVVADATDVGVINGDTDTVDDGGDVSAAADGIDEGVAVGAATANGFSVPG